MNTRWRSRLTLWSVAVAAGAALLSCADGTDDSADSTATEPGEGEAAERRRELEEARCSLEASCGIETDPPCSVFEQQLCISDVMGPECFQRYEALGECTLALSCDGLSEYMGRRPAAVRPCQAELDAYLDDAVDCPNFDGFGTECDVL
jgi:hypothetical protein